MIIYSEITGKQYTSVDECLAEEQKIIAQAAEEEQKKKEAEAEAKRKKNQEIENIIKEIDSIYEQLVEDWSVYVDLSHKYLWLTGQLDEDTELDLEDKATLLVEVVLDDEDRRKGNFGS